MAYPPLPNLLLALGLLPNLLLALALLPNLLLALGLLRGGMILRQGLAKQPRRLAIVRACERRIGVALLGLSRGN